MRSKGFFTDIIRFLQGFLVGSGAVLPGISGGALCMSFGYYLPMIEIISNPKNIKKYLRLVIAFGLGWLVSFFVCAKLIGVFFEKYEFEATLIFGGLIIGSLPQLIKDANKNGVTKGCYIGLGCGFAFTSALMLCVTMFSASLTPNAFWYAFNGVLWGLSLIFPGFNTTPITVSLGIYDAWASGVGAFDVSVLLPWLLALVVTAFVLSRTVSSLVKKHLATVSYVMIGVVSASTAVMLVQTITAQTFDTVKIILIPVLILTGAGLAFVLDKLTNKEKQV